MNTLYIILITLLVYSIVGTLAYIVSKENDDVIIAFGLGIFGLTLCGILLIMRKIDSEFKYHIGKRSIFEETSTGNKYKCKVRDASDVEWLDGYEIVKRYAIKDEWSDIPDFPKELIEKSKRNCDHCRHDNECICDYPYDKVRCKHDEWGRVIEFDKFEEK